MRALCAYKEYIRMESLRYFHSFLCTVSWSNSKVSGKRNIAEVCKVMETELHHPGERVFNKHAAVM